MPKPATTVAGWRSGRSSSAARPLIFGDCTNGTTAIPIASPRLVNMYGITETTVHVTCAPLDRALSTAGPRNLIGVGLSDLRVYVLDSVLQPCPVGVIGELYVAGAGLGRGYWRQPGTTAERFVANPFASVPGERLYRSGDLATWSEDGTLLFHGRADQQVKVRGFRIEPGEIEAALLDCPWVAQAAVAMRNDQSADSRLVAYVVSRRDAPAPIDLHAVRRHLVAALPDYMVPAAFVLLDSLPLTSNGKLNRAALPSPSGSGLAVEYVAPTTHEETVLCDLVATLLHLERVGLADHFFHLGGHSLLATRLAAQIRMRLGLELPLRAIFDTPVLGDLARTLRTLPDASIPLTPQARPDSLPLSFAQARLWFLHQMESPTAAYNVPVAVRLQGSLDVAALIAAIDDVRERHESLRTQLIGGSDGPRQWVAPIGTLPPALQVVSSTSATLEADLSIAAAHSFDLANELPLRATLFRIGSENHALLLLLHHTAADGWSIEPLLDDLAAAYTARRLGRAPALAPLPVQYADFTLWQRARLGDEHDSASLAGRQLAYWAKTLAGLPAELTLPTDHARPRASSDACGVIAFTVPAGLHADLQALARTHGATLFMVLQAALAAWLTRVGAGTDIPIGTPVAGRTEAALDRLVGLFLNTLVLRTDTSGDPAFTTLLERARTSSLGAYANQDVPFERLVEVLDPPRVVGRQPLFQTMLVLQHAPPPLLVLPDVTSSPMASATRATKFDLSFGFTETQGPTGFSAGMTGELEYSAALFEHASAERFASQLIRVLEQVVRDPARPLHELDVLAPGERHRVVHVFNATAEAFSPSTLVDLFERQAKTTPNAVALSWGEHETMTYAALDARANQLAWLLRSNGIGPETRVAIWLWRSPELVIATLAALKTGAAYLPLDPDHPVERVAFMLRDARPLRVVTSMRLASRVQVASRDRHLPRLARNSRGSSCVPGVGPYRCRPPDAVAPASRGVPDLHLRQHRSAQGRGRHASEHHALSRRGDTSCPR